MSQICHKLLNTNFTSPSATYFLSFFCWFKTHSSPLHELIRVKMIFSSAVSMFAVDSNQCLLLICIANSHITFCRDERQYISWFERNQVYRLYWGEMEIIHCSVNPLFNKNMVPWKIISNPLKETGTWKMATKEAEKQREKMCQRELHAQHIGSIHVSSSMYNVQKL